MEDGSAAAEYFERNLRQLTRVAGLIREPVQKRVYPLGSAATAVVGFLIDAPTGTPVGAYAITLDAGALTQDVQQAASLVGSAKFHAALKRFGFGSKTDTAGIPGEAAGIMASRPELWNKNAAMCAGMGYGISVTCLQVAQAYAILSNHGRFVRPRLIAESDARKSRDKATDFMSATNEIEQVLSPFAADAIAKTLENGMSTAIVC